MHSQRTAHETDALPQRPFLSGPPMYAELTYTTALSA
jgi:hypothetical protein